MRKPFHLGIVPGGVAKWARQHDLPLYSAHQSAIFQLDHVSSAAFRQGVRVLTLFAFPKQAALESKQREKVLSVYGAFLSSQAHRSDARAPWVRVFGRRDRLPESVLRSVRKAESVTRASDAPLLRLGLDYDARESVEEARAILDTAVGYTFADAMALAVHEPAPVSPTDLILVTGGEGNTERVLYWEPLYAAVRCLDVLWPDFDCALLDELIGEARKKTVRVT